MEKLNGVNMEMEKKESVIEKKKQEEEEEDPRIEELQSLKLSKQRLELNIAKVHSHFIHRQLDLENATLQEKQLEFEEEIETLQGTIDAMGEVIVTIAAYQRPIGCYSIIEQKRQRSSRTRIRSLPC